MLQKRCRDGGGERAVPLALVALIGFAAIGCEAERKDSRSCYQGDSFPCYCEQGQEGSRECRADGTWNPACICSSRRDGGGDGGNDGDSGESSKPSLCGNGIVDRFESCDGDDLGGMTCFSLGRGSGTLACNPVFCGFDLSGCTSTFDPGATGYYTMPGPFIDALPDGGSLAEIETISDWGCPPWEAYTPGLSQGQWPENLPQCMVAGPYPTRLVASGIRYRLLCDLSKRRSAVCSLAGRFHRLDGGHDVCGHRRSRGS